MDRSLHFVDGAPPPMHLLHLHQTTLEINTPDSRVPDTIAMSKTHIGAMNEIKVSCPMMLLCCNDLCAQLHEQDVAGRRGLDGGDLQPELPVQRLHDPEQEPVPARAPELHQRVALDDGHLHLRARHRRRPARAAGAAAAARFHGSHLTPRLRHCRRARALSSLLLRGS